MTIEFETKKSVADRFGCWLLLLVVVAIAVCFGYNRGYKAMKDQAIQNGHMIYKDGEPRWQPMRYIKQGI